MEDAAQPATVEHFPDVKAGHYGLASACVIGQQKAQRVLGQHVLIDRHALMREGNDAGNLPAKRLVALMAIPQSASIHHQLDGFGVASKFSVVGMASALS